VIIYSINLLILLIFAGKPTSNPWAARDDGLDQFKTWPADIDEGAKRNISDDIKQHQTVSKAQKNVDFSTFLTSYDGGCNPPEWTAWVCSNRPCINASRHFVHYFVHDSLNLCLPVRNTCTRSVS
jgi:hypothetical protein